MKTFNLIERKQWEQPGFEDRFRTAMETFYDFTIFVESEERLNETQNGRYAIIHGVGELHALLDQHKAMEETVHIVLNLPKSFKTVSMPTGQAQYSDYALPIRVISDTARAATYKADAVTFIFETPVPEVN